MELTFHPIEQPILKPLEPCWFESDTLPALDEHTLKALEDGERQRQRDAEEYGL